MKSIFAFILMCSPALAGTAVVSGHDNVVKIDSGTRVTKTISHTSSYTSAPTTVMGGNASIAINNPRNLRNNPDVSVPGLVAGVFTCTGSRSAGASGMGFGVGLGGTHRDKDCELRANAAIMASMGYKEPARQVLCQNPVMALAFEKAGQSCDKPQLVQSAKAVKPQLAKHKHAPGCKH